MNETTYPIITSNGAKLTLDILKEAVEFAIVDWTMVAFAFGNNASFSPFDICLADFFNSQKWHEVDSFFLEECDVWDYKGVPDDKTSMYALAHVISRRAEIDWMYLAKKRGWDILMQPYLFKAYDNLNIFEADIYRSAMKNGFKLRYKDKDKDGQIRKYWVTSALYGERTFMVVVTFADIDRNVHGMADTIWTSENAYINIEEGYRLRYHKPFRTAYKH